MSEEKKICPLMSSNVVTACRDDCMFIQTWKDTKGKMRYDCSMREGYAAIAAWWRLHP